MNILYYLFYYKSTIKYLFKIRSYYKINKYCDYGRWHNVNFELNNNNYYNIINPHWDIDLIIISKKEYKESFELYKKLLILS